VLGIPASGSVGPLHKVRLAAWSEVGRIDEALALVGVACAERDAGLRHGLDEAEGADRCPVKPRADAACGFDVRQLPEVAEAREIGLQVRAVEVTRIVLARQEIGPHEPGRYLEARAPGRPVIELCAHDHALRLHSLRRLGARR
jgi:hypothetical protein